MTARLDGYVQPNIFPVNNRQLFTGSIEELRVEDPSDFSDLYGQLQTEGSQQAKLLANLVLRGVEKVEFIIPNRRWVPSHVTCSPLNSGGAMFDERGVSLVALQHTGAILKKKGLTVDSGLLPHTVGFVLNTSESPDTELIISRDKARTSQNLLVISGRLVKN